LAFSATPSNVLAGRQTSATIAGCHGNELRLHHPPSSRRSESYQKDKLHHDDDSRLAQPSDTGQTAPLCLTAGRAGQTCQVIDILIWTLLIAFESNCILSSISQCSPVSFAPAPSPSTVACRSKNKKALIVTLSCLPHLLLNLVNSRLVLSIGRVMTLKSR
jgi:hypothetical protein